jgi:hypothetical protein
MSLENRQIDELIQVARVFCQKLQAGSAIADTTTYIPVVGDFPGLPTNVNTTAKIAVLVNRYFREGRSENVAPRNKLGDIAET